MKGLAWYTVIILLMGVVSLFEDAVTTYSSSEVSTSIWGIAGVLPVILFAALYLKKAYK